MNHSRTSGDSRRRGKRLLKFHSYFNMLSRGVKSDLSRSAAPPPGNASNGDQQLSVVGPTTIECFGREPRGPVVRFELSGPNGERISFPIRCGLFAAGGDHE